MHEVMGAILAGGKSLRMGRDKATLPLRDGRSMIEHVAAALSAATTSNRIVIVGGEAQMLDALASHGIRPTCMGDVRAQAGPLGGIETLLASGLEGEFLVCPCDVPAISSDVLRLLLQKRDAMATVLHVTGREHFEPLPARVTAAALPVVRRLLDDGVRSVWRLMEELPAAIVEIDAAHAAALRNVNTPDDLSMA